jgi:hypothetical protein
MVVDGSREARDKSHQGPAARWIAAGLIVSEMAMADAAPSMGVTAGLGRAEYGG